MTNSVEVTHIEEANAYVCNNCGAYSTKEETINHYPSCKKGESKRWEKFYKEQK